MSAIKKNMECGNKKEVGLDTVKPVSYEMGRHARLELVGICGCARVGGEEMPPSGSWQEGRESCLSTLCLSLYSQ